MDGDEFEAVFKKAVLEERDPMRENTLDEEWTNLAGFDDKVVVATKNWMDMTATFVGRNVKVALMGLFERINPLKYEGNLKGNRFLVFEHDEWLKAVFPLTLRLACGEFKYLSHEVSNANGSIKKFSSSAVEVSTKIPANVMELEYLFHILYTE